MLTRPITITDKKDFNSLATHPLQTYEWGEFREAFGTRVKRIGFYKGEKLTQGISMTLHPIPKTPWNIGYFPKGVLPNKEVITELQRIGKDERCVFIQMEPNILRKDALKFPSELPLTTAAHPLFTKYTFLLDLATSEEDMLKTMHSKTRYNIRVAQKHNVTIKEENTDEAFNDYLTLTRETTIRQNFYAHSENYHKTLWKVLGPTNPKTKHNDLSLHLFIARYNGIPLTAWIIFTLHDTMYYPYGASSSLHRNVMSSTLMMWEVIKWGKGRGLKKFDMWGAADVIDPQRSHPYFGFHRFKQDFGPEYTEFVGSYDLIITNPLYNVYKIADKLRWAYLKFKR